MLKVSRDVKIIEYSREVDKWNFATHLFGALSGVAALVMLLLKALPTSNLRIISAAVIYGLSIIAVYTVSALYHALPISEHKRRARLLDHVTVSLLIAGTATPCAMITLCSLNVWRCVLVMCIAWFCFLFGFFAKLFFFEKLKAACIAVYITGGSIMMLSAVPVLNQISKPGFAFLSAGCIAYLIGCLYCRAGIKKPELHIVFHIFVVIGTLLHFIGIYMFVF